MGSLFGGTGGHGDLYKPLLSPCYPLFLLTCLAVSG